MRTVLTIAGSDSGGGAGIQADLRTFAAHGVFGTSAITAITSQNTLGVAQVFVLPASVVASQIDAVANDFTLAAVKIGMLANAEIVDVVAEALVRHGLAPVVLDPVIAATRGEPLLDDAGVARLVDRLLPLVTVLTPNLAEAARLTGIRVLTLDDARRAARMLMTRGVHAVVVTGGHLPGAPIDLLLTGDREITIAGARIDTPHTHGTGCTFASALAARLGLGDTLEDAARAAKIYVTNAILRAPGLGHGHGPLA